MDSTLKSFKINHVKVKTYRQVKLGQILKFLNGFDEL